jgi:transposase-like protein
MPGGRPSKLTPELTEALCELLRQGKPLNASCEKVGIDDSTFRKWRAELKRGTADDAKVEFFTQVARARAEGQLALLDTALGGDEKGESNGPARCAQWALERLFPAQYAPRLNVKLEEGLELLLEDVERVCSSKDCGCYEAILTAVAARQESGGASGADSGVEDDRPIH